MKQLVLIILFSFLCLNLYANTESWNSLGVEAGNFFGSSSNSTDSAKSYMFAPGINFSSYTFRNNHNIGFFANSSYLFPITGILNSNGVIAATDYSGYDMFINIGIVIGPAFKYKIGEDLFVRGGAGIGISETIGINNNDTLLYLNIGIGADIGLKYDLSKRLFIDFGSKFSADFASFVLQDSSSGWVSNYFMFGVKPYISVGLNIFKEDKSRLF